MQHIRKEYLDDYHRWVDTIHEDPYSGRETIGIIDVLKAHYLLVDFFSAEYGEGIGGIGPRDINLLYSAVGRQFTGYGSKSKWNSEYEKCSTLFYGLIKDHPFHDANKRTAVLILLYHLLKINLTPSAKQKDFEILAIRIASNELSKYPNFSRWDNVYDGEVHFIADFLRKNTRTTKKNEYIITYRDLNSILIRYSFELVNPVDNRIDIVSNREETVGLIKRKRIIITKRIGTIDFPGWGRQVNVKDIKYVRKLTGLTHDNGIDTEVFFHNAEPFNSLILQYQNPLKRLADK